VNIKKRPSIAETHPALAAQAVGWDPTTVTKGSDKKVGWKCELGHQWKATPGSRTRTKSVGCPVCAGKKVLAGYNDLATLNPELAAQADGWDPTTVTQRSHKRVDWKCEIGHRWNMDIKNRSYGTKCPFCTNNKVLAGFNDLATLNPELAAQADGWDPTTVGAGVGTVVDWKCELGHRWKARMNDRNYGSECPVCINQMVLIGFNDLATTNPELAAQADGWDPTTVTAGSSTKKVSWKCVLGHKWKAKINDRKKRGCPYCGNQKVLAGFNDLATTNPELAAQADGWDPTTVIEHSNKKYPWKCVLGHRWKSTADNRANGYGCPTCAVTGFDPNKPGWLYLIDHDGHEMFQIGITNKPDDRLGDHKGRGWEVIELRGPMDGHLTRQLETSCLRAIGKRGAIRGHKAGIKKFDGYSEAWTKASLKVSSIKQILDWVYEDEEAVNNS